LLQYSPFPFRGSVLTLAKNEMPHPKHVRGGFRRKLSMQALEQNCLPCRISMALHSKPVPHALHARITLLPTAKYWQRVLQNLALRSFAVQHLPH
jgi:hypothetical protein